MQQQNQQTASSKSSDKMMGRRGFLKVSAAALALATLPGCGESKPVEAVEDSELTKLKQDYLDKGSLDPKLGEYLLKAEFELARPRSEEYQRFNSFAEFQSASFEAFERDVQDGFASKVSSGTEAPIALLQSLHQALLNQHSGRLFVQTESNGMLDPFVTGRLQARSGTQLFLYFATKHLLPSLASDEKLVVIYTRNHSLPGILKDSGELRGFETTRATHSINFGPVSELSFPVRVCDAAHVMASSLFETSKHRAETVLFENKGAEALPEKPSSKSAGELTRDNAMESAGNFGPERFVLAEDSVVVPPGAQLFERFEFQPASLYRLQTTPSSYFIPPESFLRDEYPTMSGREQLQLWGYFRHSEYFQSFRDELRNLRSFAALDRSRARSRSGDITLEATQYWRRNLVEEAGIKAKGPANRLSNREAPSYELYSSEPLVLFRQVERLHESILRGR